MLIKGAFKGRATQQAVHTQYRYGATTTTTTTSDVKRHHRRQVSHA